MPDDIEVPPSFVDLDRPLGLLAREYLDALLGGDRARAAELILDTVEEGVLVRDIYLDVFQRTQWEVGRLWELNRITVAEEHYCTAATQLVMSRLSAHVPDVADVIKATRQSGAKGGPIIFDGGHPFNADGELWRSVGADGHAPGADGAVLVAEELVAAKRAP